MDLFRSLLDARADPMEVSADGSTIYHCMVLRNNDPMLRYLIPLVAETARDNAMLVQQVNSYGKTALHDACNHNNELFVNEIVKVKPFANRVTW